MVYELYVDAVRTKVTRFEHASRLINGKELACAVGMAFRQAELPMPEPEDGTEAGNFQKESLERLEAEGNGGSRLADAIRTYSRQDEKVDEDMRIVLRLGYESGL